MKSTLLTLVLTLLATNSWSQTEPIKYQLLVEEIKYDCRHKSLSSWQTMISLNTHQNENGVTVISNDSEGMATKDIYAIKVRTNDGLVEGRLWIEDITEFSRPDLNKKELEIMKSEGGVLGIAASLKLKDNELMVEGMAFGTLDSLKQDLELKKNCSLVLEIEDATIINIIPFCKE